MIIGIREFGKWKWTTFFLVSSRITVCTCTHKKGKFFLKGNGMRLFPGGTVDDPAALKPCGFFFF